MAVTDQRRAADGAFKCRDCDVALTRENIGGYRAGKPDICRGCEEADYLRAYAASLAPLSPYFPYPIVGAPWE